MSDRQSGAALGALMQDARTVRGQPLDAGAAALGLSPEQYAGYESGAAEPSLPELELLAYFLDVPVSYFWGDQPLSARPEEARRALPAADIAALRHRIIGIQLRQARLAAEQTPEALAAAVGVTVSVAGWLKSRPAPL